MVQPVHELVAWLIIFSHASATVATVLSCKNAYACLLRKPPWGENRETMLTQRRGCRRISSSSRGNKTSAPSVGKLHKLHISTGHHHNCTRSTWCGHNCFWDTAYARHLSLVLLLQTRWQNSVADEQAQAKSAKEALEADPGMHLIEE